MLNTYKFYSIHSWVLRIIFPEALMFNWTLWNKIIIGFYFIPTFKYSVITILTYNFFKERKYKSTILLRSFLIRKELYSWKWTMILKIFFIPKGTMRLRSFLISKGHYIEKELWF